MTTGVGTTLTMGYDGLRRLTSVTGGPVTRQYTYRDIDSTKTTLQVASVTSGGQQYGYTYDSMGNIATYSAPGKGTVTYTYDNQGQLLSAAGDTTYTYTYDGAGNILTANGHTYTYGNADWKDLLTAFDGNSITYDAIGNPTSYYNGTRWNFTWANGRSLATASDGTNSLSFAYDAGGQRTSKTVNSTTYRYYYASGKLMHMTWGTNAIDFFYDANGTPYAMKYNGTVYYYITNLQGDVMRIVDASQNGVASYEYDPYGKVISAMGILSDVNPLRYRGYVYDQETGFYYLQSRYYDPAIGRFLNADNLLIPDDVIGANLLAYCRSNPVNNVDSWGNKPKDLFDSIDEAAHDFANYINERSIEQNREYATYIYAVDVSGVPPLLLFMFKLIGADVFVNEIVKIKYTYVNPAKGTKDSTYIPPNWFGIHNTVAIAHTHAAYSPEYINNSFSDADIAEANKRGIPIYVATPLGLLRRYDPADGSDIIIYWDIPSDPNYPDL